MGENTRVQTRIRTNALRVAVNALAAVLNQLPGSQFPPMKSLGSFTVTLKVVVDATGPAALVAVMVRVPMKEA